MMNKPPLGKVRVLGLGTGSQAISDLADAFNVLCAITHDDPITMVDLARHAIALEDFAVAFEQHFAAVIDAFWCTDAHTP